MDKSHFLRYTHTHTHTHTHLRLLYNKDIMSCIEKRQKCFRCNIKTTNNRTGLTFGNCQFSCSDYGWFHDVPISTLFKNDCWSNIQETFLYQLLQSINHFFPMEMVDQFWQKLLSSIKFKGGSENWFLDNEFYDIDSRFGLEIKVFREQNNVFKDLPRTCFNAFKKMLNHFQE